MTSASLPMRPRRRHRAPSPDRGEGRIEGERAYCSLVPLTRITTRSNSPLCERGARVDLFKMRTDSLSRVVARAPSGVKWPVRLLAKPVDETTMPDLPSPTASPRSSIAQEEADQRGHVLPAPALLSSARGGG